MPENGRCQTEHTRLLRTQSSTTAPQTELDDCQTKHDAADQSITPFRGTVIFFSLMILVFLQGSVLLQKQHTTSRLTGIAAATSLMITMQSTVARDLDPTLVPVGLHLRIL